MEKLPEDFKKKWLEALRSGEYKQGKASLRSFKQDPDSKDFAYCCLGIACIVAGYKPKEINGVYVDGAKYPRVPSVLYNGSTGTVSYRLGVMNDGEEGVKPKSFAQIANWIEKNL